MLDSGTGFSSTRRSTIGGRCGTQVVAQLSAGLIHHTGSWGHKGHPHGTTYTGPNTDVAADLCRSDSMYAVTLGSPCVRWLRQFIVRHHSLGRGIVTPGQQVRLGV